MFKGIGKQVVVLKNTDSQIFEEAIFILKEKSNLNKKDLLTECERIINKNSTAIKANGIQSNKKINLYILGAVAAVIIAIVLTASIL